MDGCSFKCNFNFPNSVFKAPSTYIEHSCLGIQHTTAPLKTLQPKNIANHPGISEWVAFMGSEISRKSLDAHLLSSGIQIEDKNTLSKALMTIKTNLYGKKQDQFQKIESFLIAMKHIGHKTEIHTVDNAFKSCFIVFKQSIFTFPFFKEYVLQFFTSFFS